LKAKKAVQNPYNRLLAESFSQNKPRSAMAGK